jgi:hypothetical protein
MDELDPRKLYELSESLNELTGTVKYTDEAMRSMLGPQAEANRKLKESGKARADAGGIFDGPGKNSVMINSNSMPANDILTSLRESFGSVQKKSIESEVPKLTKFNTMSPGGRGGSSSSSMDILERFTDIMEQKMSDVIDAISDNNNIKEEILLYSKV